MTAVTATILHLEDSDLDADLVKGWLDRVEFPFQLDRAADRPGFVERLVSRRYDLILSDYQVPAFDGLDALELARQHQPETPFIFVSGMMGEELAVESLKRGATDYLLKQRLTRLPAAVQRALSEARAGAERKRVEDLARVTTARAAAVLESIDDSFVVLDQDWRFTYANAAFARISGFSRDETLGKEPWDLFPGTLGTRFETELRSVAAQGRTTEFEYWYEPLDRWLAVKAYPAVDGNGISVHARDITESKRVAESLKASEERLRTVTDAARVGLVIVDAEHRYRFANRAYPELLGLATQDLVGLRVADVLASVYLQQVKPRLEQAFAGQRVNYELTMPAAPGSAAGPRHFSVAYEPQTEASGARSVVVAITDITDRKRAEEQLQRREEELRTITDAIPVLISYLDKDGYYRFVNRQYEEWFKKPREAFLDHDVREVVGPEVYSVIQHHIARVLAGERFDFETYVPYRGGGRFVRASYVPRIENGQVTGFFALGADVSESKRAEEELRTKTERLDLLLDNVKDYAVVIFDPQGNILEWLAGAERITGFAVEEAEKESAGLLFTPEDRAAGIPEEEMRTALREGRAEDKRWHLRKDGSRFFASGVMTPMRDAVGKLRGFAKVFRDETERVMAEISRRASEERFRALVTATSDVVYRMSPDWTEMNQLDGRSFVPDTLGPNRTWLDLYIPPEDQPQVLQAIAEAIQTRSVFQMEHRIVQVDGNVGWTFSRAIPILGADGQIVEWFGTASDMTRRKEAEENLARLLAAERRHAALLERIAGASRVVNAVLSAESIAKIVTEEARDLLGASAAATTFGRSEDGAQEIRASVPEDWGKGSDSVPVFDPELASAVSRTGQPVRIASSKTGASCSRLAVPLTGPGGKSLGVLQLAGKGEGDFSSEDEAVLVQLGSIAAAGIENARLYEQLREQDRRKDEFLATLAHELRNPLAPIRTGIAVLKLAEAPHDIVRAREMMDRQVNHMVRLIDDLLDISRITRGKVEFRRERVDVRNVLTSAIEVSLPIIEAGQHHLSVSLPQETLWLDADPIRLAQVVSNLLNNSAKYTPQGGQIDLTAWKEGASTIVLSVRDNGLGIPREMLPKVFELFTQVGRTLGRSQGGLGIGLALVKRLVEMHGGTLTAESEGEGRGSTFTVRLPLLEAAESLPLQPTAPVLLEVASSSAARRILVVDDNEDAAISLAMLLQMGGHSTRTAHSGPEALEVARGFGPEVIFLDIGMPGMNGYEVAAQLRRDTTFQGVVLIALTGWGTDEDRRRSAQAGFDHHLTKPVQPAQIGILLGGLPRPSKRSTPASGRS